MSISGKNKEFLCEDEWAFVDFEGCIMPKKELQNLKEKNAMRKRSNVKSRKNHDQEPEFEIIPEKDLTTSIVIATTEMAPLDKNHDDANGEEWRILENPEDNSKTIDESLTTPQEKQLCSPSSEEIEFIQIPDKQPGNPMENFSDSSSTCSFDVIDDKKTASSHVSEVNTDITEMKFHLEFPILVALFFITTALGFIIGHGVGIATNFLVVKAPSLKIPPNVPKIPKSLPEEEIKKSQDSQLEGKIQKWKSMYRKITQEQDKFREKSLSRIVPGLKEAHKKLSMENFKLKKANDDIQKEFDLMKVMSRHWRSQLDIMKTEVMQNKSYIVEILKKELEYLEGVYKREKKLADMWRHEVEQRNGEKVKSKMNAWKEFKEHWTKESKDEPKNKTVSTKDSCTENGGCKGTSQDTTGSDRLDVAKEDNDQEEMSLFWQHMETRLQDMYNENGLKNENDLKKENDLKNADNENQAGEDKGFDKETVKRDSGIKDVGGLAGTSRDIENNLENMKEEAADEKVEDKIKINKELESRNLDHQHLGWFKKEIMEIHGDIVVALENKDVKDHRLYGFWGGEFHEICSGPGDVFVMSISKDCLDTNISIIVSVQNDSPQPVEFLAVLPNGKVKHLQIAEEVKITMTYSGKPSDQGLAEVETAEKNIVYEAIVGIDSKLLATPQKDEQKEQEEHKDEYKDEHKDEHKDEKVKNVEDIFMANETEGSSENENNAKSEHAAEMGTVQKQNARDISENLEPENKSSGLKKVDNVCSLKLGESVENEYWTSCDHEIVVEKERVERVNVTLMHKEEDMKKLNVSSEKIVETVSYVFCGDGSVEKTWRRTEKISKEEIEDMGDKNEDIPSSKNKEFCLDDINCKKSSKDDGGDKVGGNDDDYGNGNDYDDDHDDHNDHDDDHDNDHDDNDYDNDDHDDDDHDNDHDDDDNDHDDDDHDNDHDNDHDDNNHDDNHDDHDNDHDNDDHNEDGSDNKINKSYNAHPSNSEEVGQAETGHSNSMVHEIGENYQKYLKNEWLNLKIRQRQFEMSKKQNTRLQKRMIKEWKRMKEEYRSLKKHKESEEYYENKRRVWRNMKYQQQLLDKWKKQIMEELKETLKEEWEKMKKERKEVELKEKELNIKREILQQNNNMVFAKVDGKMNIDEQASMAWELAHDKNSELVYNSQMQRAHNLLARDHNEENNNPGVISTKNADIGLELSDIQQANWISTTQINKDDAKTQESLHKTQQETQLEKLRELLNELHSSLKGSKNELQAVNKEMASSELSKEQTKHKNSPPDSKYFIQPKCPVKCPQKIGDATSELKDEVNAREDHSIQEHPKIKITEKVRVKENGYAMHDFIQGINFLNKVKVNKESDASWLKPGLVPPNIRGWKKKKHNDRDSDKDGKKKRNKNKGEKQEKEKHHLYRKDQIKKQKQRKTFKQNQ